MPKGMRREALLSAICQATRKGGDEGGKGREIRTTVRENKGYVSE